MEEKATFVLGSQHEHEHEHDHQNNLSHADPYQQLKAALSLAQAMPPSKIRKNLIGLIKLAPEIEDNLLQKIDLPMQIDESDAQNPFLKTQFNRDGDSYRSSITNQYYPSAEGYRPTGEWRKLQEIGNILFAQYTKLYYGNGAVGSFFVNEGKDANHFCCGYFAKKNYLSEQQNHFDGSWDSFNIVDIQIQGEEATLQLSTTVLIQMNIQKPTLGNVQLNGFLKKQKKQTKKVGKDRNEELLAYMGQMIEELQTVMRQYLQAIYVGKTKEIVFSTRYEQTIDFENQRKSLAEGLKNIHLQG